MVHLANSFVIIIYGILPLFLATSSLVAVQLMGKYFCAVGFSNRFFKECGLQFYHFPADSLSTNSWVATLNRKNWQPIEYT